MAEADLARTPFLPPVDGAPGVARTPRSRLRVRLLGLLAAVLGLGAIGTYAYRTLFPADLVSTNDAYVGADVATVTALTSGIVARVSVEDAEFVKAGDVLVQLNDSDARLAVESARAALSRALRGFDQVSANDGALAAAVRARIADALTAHDTFDRKAALYGQGWVTRADYVEARDAASAADAAVATAREQLDASRAQIANDTRQQTPDVQSAYAQLRQAQLTLSRTTIRAPIAGIVSNRDVQVGQQVAPGAPLMSVVPVDRVYVDANFTEKELANIRAGQPATLTADVYGAGIVYHGTVAGIGGGTGSAFALIPAQNATGNWIKVVQRVPVRIRLSPKDVAAHPLRVGLSMTATVDTSRRGA